MEYTLYLLILFEILVTPSLLRDLPSYVKICKRNDPELSKCFINSMNTIRPYLIKGIPEMELPQGEPLQYYDVKAKSDVGRVRVSASAWNQTSYGFMDYDLKSVNFDFENAKCNASVFFPKIKLTGKYNFQGKVLLFAVDTIGDFEINTTNVLANVDFTGRYYTKKSQQYLEFNQVDLKLNLGDTAVRFENVINGNQDLSDTVNQAVNENIDAIIEELRPVFEGTFAGIVQLYFNTVFRLFPMDTLFPTE